MSDNQNLSSGSPIPSSPWLKHIRQDVQSMHAYAIQDSTGMVKLDAMENPFSLPPELQAELGQRLGALALNRYPDGRVNDLRTALAQYVGMPAGHDRRLVVPHRLALPHQGRQMRRQHRRRDRAAVGVDEELKGGHGEILCICTVS